MRFGFKQNAKSIRAGGLALPSTGLLFKAMLPDLTDTIGLSISDYDFVRAELRSIFFGAGPVLLDAETIITNIEASEFFNCGWELTGDSTKGYALYADWTSESILTKAYRYFGETYSVGHVTFGGESVTFGGEEVSW